jgi:heat-inducible transcriptional repressor
MRTPALNDRRNRQILADIVRTYIETGEPVSSRAIARRYAEPLSPATIRNVMSDLEDEGLLYQPHTSAGRVPTPAAYRFFVQEIASQATLEPEDQKFIRDELAAAFTPDEIMERASHVLAKLSHGLGIVLSPPISRIVLEYIRFVLLPDGRILAVLVSGGGLTRDKVMMPDRSFTQDELDRTANYLNQTYRGWTLRAIREDLEKHILSESQRYDHLANNALVLCKAESLAEDAVTQVYVEGAAQIATAPEFADQRQLRELLETIEERKKLVALLTSCIEAPEPIQVQIGVKEISSAGENLALIMAPYACHDRVQGSLGVLGPLRMQYERAITAVAYVAKIFNQQLSGVESP